MPQPRRGHIEARIGAHAQQGFVDMKRNGVGKLDTTTRMRSSWYGGTE